MRTFDLHPNEQRAAREMAAVFGDLPLRPNGGSSPAPQQLFKPLPFPSVPRDREAEAGRLQAEAQREEALSDPANHFVLVPAGDGEFDAMRICVLHSWASPRLPAEDRRFCSYCPACEFRAWLGSDERDRAARRFQQFVSGRTTAVGDTSKER